MELGREIDGLFRGSNPISEARLPMRSSMGRSMTQMRVALESVSCVWRQSVTQGEISLRADGCQACGLEG